MRPHGSSWVLMGLYRSLCNLIDSNRYIWVLIGPKASLIVVLIGLKSPDASLWIVMGPYGSLLVLMRPYGSL